MLNKDGEKDLRAAGSRRRRMALVALALAAFALVAFLGSSYDTSPLVRVPESLAVARDVSYGPHAQQTLDLVHARVSSRPRPALLMIHQGGWMQGDKSAYHHLMIQYALLDYVTVSVNFRPSGVAKFPAAIEDCARAVRWLRVHAAAYGVDPRRIGVTGWSSGAHLAMLLALSDGEFGKDPEHPDASSRVQAAVCVSGVYDLLLESGGQFPNAGDDAALLRFLGGAPRQNPELARRASPITYLTPDDPPLLVFHGEQDRRIDVEQARRFARASEALGRKDEVVLIADGDHGRDVLPGDSAHRQRVREFFARHLRPEP